METSVETPSTQVRPGEAGGRLEGRRYHVLTFGCQMNKNDSERLAGLLENLGMIEAPDWKDANLVVVNTCSIRDKAERRVAGRFFEMDHHRRKSGLDMKLAITGCMPQHSKKWILEELPFLDYVVGVNNYEELPDLILSGAPLETQLGLIRPNRKAAEVEKYETRLVEQKREEGSRAWVSIQFGCDKFCTYCIVPFTRGREFSRRRADILSEVDALEARGVTEVVLLGQNVNSYGKTTHPDYLFPDLLNDVADRTWLHDVSFMTSHPHDVDEKLVDVIASRPNLSKEIHFPCQHADDRILAAMNRQYTWAEYSGKVEMLRRKVPGARVGTDLIVGFPGETEEEFRRLLDACREIRFDWANTAAYSVRPGTKAERLGDQIPEPVKKRRLNELNALLRELCAAPRELGPRAVAEGSDL